MCTFSKLKMGVKCCDLQFNNFEYFDAHLKAHHFYNDQLRNNHQPFKCVFLCDRIYYTLSGFKRHLKEDHLNKLIYDSNLKTYQFKEDYLQVGVIYGVQPVQNVSISYLFVIIKWLICLCI